MFQQGEGPRGAPGGLRAGNLTGAADDLGDRLALGRCPGRGRDRRGQCLVGGLARGGRLRPARPRHVAAFAWSQRLKRDPLVLDRVSFARSRACNRRSAARLHAERRLPLRPHPDPLPRHPLRPRDVQVVKPGGKLVVTLARDAYLKRYRFFTFYWDGRTRDDGTAPPAATSCGSNCSARTALSSRAASSACTGRRARPADGLQAGPRSGRARRAR